MKIQRHIEIVVTNTVGLNIMIKSSVEAVRKSLSKKYTNVSVTRIKCQKDLDELIQRKPDLVFSGVKYLGFDDKSKKRYSKNKIWLSSVLKKHGINHTGSEVQALELDINKVKAKMALSKKHIPTADFFTVFPGQSISKSLLPIGFPLFIKPIYEGGGKGIDECSLVRNFNEFTKKILHLHREVNAEVLVEKYLPGREFTVGIINNLATNKLDAFPVELIPQVNSRGDSFLGKKDKQEDNELVVSIEERKLFKKVSQFAKKSFRALGARDYGRIDIRMDQNNRLYFLEANLVPGLNGGYFTRAFGMVQKETFSQMINSLASLAMNRAG